LSDPAGPARTVVLEVPPVDLRTTLRALPRSGRDPTCRLGPDGLWRASWTPAGPATVQVPTPTGVVTTVEARAWGSGAEVALAGLADLVGADDRPEDFVAHHDIVAEAVRRRPGRRMVATRSLTAALVPTVLEQKVTGLEAARSYRGLARAHGGVAPGPRFLLLPPRPDRLADLGYADLHRFDVERRRAEVVLAVARRADRLDALVDRSPAEARRVLTTLPGLGPWTAAVATQEAFGDPDAVIVGDFHLPHLVVHALTGRRRGDDEEMLALLAPYEGQRARAQQVLARLGAMARRAPRSAPRRIASI